MSDNSVSVVCDNPGCSHHGVVRTVGLTHLGQGVYQHPTVVCECQPTWTLRVTVLPADQLPGTPVGDAQAATEAVTQQQDDVIEGQVVEVSKA